VTRASQGWGAWRALILAACFLTGTPCLAQTETPSKGAEYQVKAAFLYKFAGYIQWPDKAAGPPDAPFTFGVLGADALADELAQLVEGRTLNGRTVAVQKLKPGASLDGVQVLFVGKGDATSIGGLRQWVKQRPVLVVTEFEGALERGSMINFVLAERRVRFEIALEPAEKSGLRMSSRLLAVAQKVLPGGS
jgi:YfiR/HmsC-like